MSVASVTGADQYFVWLRRKQVKVFWVTVFNFMRWYSSENTRLVIVHRTVHRTSKRAENLNSRITSLAKLSNCAHYNSDNRIWVTDLNERSLFDNDACIEVMLLKWFLKILIVPCMKIERYELHDINSDCTSSVPSSTIHQSSFTCNLELWLILVSKLCVNLWIVKVNRVL